MNSSVPNNNAQIEIRRHPFSSPEARFLTTELDKSLAAVYPNWDQLAHPILEHDHNPVPSEDQIAKHAARTAENGDVGFEEQEKREGLVFWVAFDGCGVSSGDASQASSNPAVTGKAIGCAALRLFNPERPLPQELDPSLRYAELKRMYVLPAYRGRGISKMLVQTAEQYARDILGLDCLVLETGVDMTAGLRLYESAGYKRRGMFGQYVGADPVSGGVSACMEKMLR